MDRRRTDAVATKAKKPAESESVRPSVSLPTTTMRLTAGSKAPDWSSMMRPRSGVTDCAKVADVADEVTEGRELCACAHTGSGHASVTRNDVKAIRHAEVRGGLPQSALHVEPFGFLATS